MHCVVAIVIVSVVVASAYSREIPSYLTPCKHSDPKLNECVAKAIEDLRPRLAKGLPDLFIPPLEPLRVPIANLDQGDFKAEFRDLEIYQVTNFKVNSVEIKPDENTFRMELEFPNLRIKSHYSISGDLSVLKLNGQGPADGNFTNVKAVATVKGQRIKKGDKEYIDFTDNKLELEIGDGNLHFTDLFKGNEDLTTTGNVIINQNIKELIEDIKPVLVKTIEDFVFGVVKEAFANYSLDQLFAP